MAHELSFALDGTAEAFYALKPAWHGLGTVLDHAPTSAEAIKAAQLDWRVSLEEIRTASGKIVPDHYATVRSDTGAVLGCVGDKYSVVQNREAFDFLDSLFEDGLIKYESAGALRGGSRIWLLARMPSVDEIAPGDNSNRYVLFSTSHDGSASLHAIPTSVRVVCANTLRVAIASDVGFRHSGNVQRKLDYARQYLSQFDEKFTLFRDKARRLAELRYTPEQAKAYIEELFPSTGREGRSKSIRDNKVAEVRSALLSKRQQIPSIKGSWWALVNSVTESLDHSKRHTRHDRDAKEGRMISLTDGAGADFKSKAFSVAVAMAG